LASVTETSRDIEIYSDFTDDMFFHPVKGDIVRKTNEDAVSQSIRNLLKTNYYDRPFNPKIGSNLRAALFELSTEFSEIAVKAAIVEMITNFEPRADLLDVTIKADPDNYTYNATITFAIVNKQQPVTINVLLERIR
jgi:hypothetical protein